MSVPPEQFSRISDRLDISLLATKLVVVVGVGTVGSQVAAELANNSVGRLRLIDGDYLEESNLIRHALPRSYLGLNKAEALTLYLADEVPTLQAEALPRNIDESISDDELDKLLSDADLIVAATDDRDAQRWIARRALALDIPTVLPALYGDNGGEIFVQRSPRNPCFFCWDGFRPGDERLRGVAALNADTLAVLQLAVQLSLGVLDRRSEYAEFMKSEPPDSRPLQLFIQRRHAALDMAPQPRRLDCPSCAVGPSHLRKDAAETWRLAERARATAISRSRPMASPHVIRVTTHARRSPARSSSITSSQLIASGIAVFLWFSLWSEGWEGFRYWWNPAAWLIVVAWMIGLWREYGK
jgi:molybdopterin/thiamine biosynthesis adenylyltransferase